MISAKHYLPKMFNVLQISLQYVEIAGYFLFAFEIIFCLCVNFKNFILKMHNALEYSLTVNSKFSKKIYNV